MITHQVKNWTILILFILLAVSGTLNFIQVRNAKQDQQARMIEFERSNTLIAKKQGEILLRDSLIATIRRERHKDSVQNSTSQNALKQRVAILRGEIAKLPKVIPYQPDSSLVDSLRVAFSLKDSTIDTQALMITSLEAEKEGIFYSFNKEIALLQEQREAQVDISNQLQNQLVSQQTQTRKAERGKRFWKRTAGVITVVAAAVVTFVTLKE